MIDSFEIIGNEDVKREVSAAALEWLTSNEGVRVSRRKALAAEHSRGDTVVDEEDKESIMHQAKVEALEEKRKSLDEEENDTRTITKGLFRTYVVQNKRSNFQDTMSFEDWVTKREDNRRGVRKARKEWVESKDEERKRRDAAGSKVREDKSIEHNKSSTHYAIDALYKAFGDSLILTHNVEL